MSSASSLAKVLVVGTTSDYIQWIRRCCPGRALFLTDPQIRKQALEPGPSAEEEILCNLADYKLAEKALKNHLKRFGLHLDGITSYDCESMELAAFLSDRFFLEYPSMEAVNNCRNKYQTKHLWQEAGVPCPAGRLVDSADDAVRFLDDIGRTCVLKPVNGSGSELIFCCDSEDQCRVAFDQIMKGLTERQGNRLYASLTGNSPRILIEECIEGEEFSCDVLIENHELRILRLSKKVRGEGNHFGTIKAYILPASLPGGVDILSFHQNIIKGASALGLSRAFCTLDFMVSKGTILFLEMAPRPGGDCLPFLLRCHNKTDSLVVNLDFAQKRPILWQGPNGSSPHVGVRLHAKESGILKRIDQGNLASDPRVSEVHLPRRQGHVVQMPPKDYESWVLGHIIFKPREGADPESQCMEILDQVVVEIER